LADRYLSGLDGERRPTVLVGAGDADAGPEGPPQIASPAL
jgi:hypothetical protein